MHTKKRNKSINLLEKLNSKNKLVTSLCVYRKKKQFIKSSTSNLLQKTHITVLVSHQGFNNIWMKWLVIVVTTEI